MLNFPITPYTVGAYVVIVAITYEWGWRRFLRNTGAGVQLAFALIWTALALAIAVTYIATLGKHDDPAALIVVGLIAAWATFQAWRHWRSYVRAGSVGPPLT